MTTFGYIRVSTKFQDPLRQQRNILEKYPDAVIYCETYTGARISRPEFNKLLKRVKKGDTIVFDEVSRMSRNAEEGSKLYKELMGKGVNLVFLKEPHISTATYKDVMKRRIDMTANSGDPSTDELLKAISDALNKYILDLAEKQIYQAFGTAQQELDYLHTRTAEGVATAKANGKQVGRRKGAKIVQKKEAPAKEIIRKYSRSFGGQLKDKEVMQLAKISSPTYYKYKRQIAEEQAYITE